MSAKCPAGKGLGKLSLKKCLLVFLAASLVLMLCSCKPKEESSEQLCFGTVCRITAASGTDFEAIWAEMRNLEQVLSARNGTSELERLNSMAGQSWLDVSETLYTVLEKGLMIAQITNGAFNPAIGALVRLWDIGGENQRVPSDEEIREALEHISWHDIHLSREGNNYRVKIDDPELRIDLGGIGKGYAVDVAADELERQGQDSALLNFGGNVYCLGKKTDGEDYRIGIQIPFADRNVYSQVVEVSDGAVVTSGAYEKNFTSEDGILYHHILDSKTGFPSESGLVSVSIVGPEGAICDGLSTAFFVLGEKRALELIGSFIGYGCLIIREDGSAISVGIES